MTDLHPEVASAMARAMWARHKIPLSQRFWSKVEKKGENECWIWNGTRNRAGYGTFAKEHHKHGSRPINVMASRMAWELTYNKPFPEGKYALHKCDNPPCVNPNHIFIGTIADNQKDMALKGRGSGPIKLTKEQVLEIRSEYQEGEHGHGYIALAKKYGLGPSTVHDIIKRRIWKRV